MRDQENGELISIVECAEECEIIEVLEANNLDKKLSVKKQGKNYISYYNTFGTFDIETTSLTDKGLMYLWGFCIGEDVIIGRNWEEFLLLINTIVEYFDLNYNFRFVIYVHNLSFEFQFMRNFLKWEEIFALEEREPITALSSNGIEFRCSYKLTNMSLMKFCEQSKKCIHYKKDGDKFNYKKLRFPDTKLLEYEYIYQYCDAKGLHESLEELLEDDNIARIPITSTGYVRRDCRNAVRKNKENRELLLRSKLDSFLYLMLRAGRRGGDTHALAQYVGEILSDVDSWDIKSSYPYVMLTHLFPMGAFREVSAYRNDSYCYLMEVTFTEVKLKGVKEMPYIPIAKCTLKDNVRNDNGRVIYASRIRTIITDIDLDIINDVYDIENIEFNIIYRAESGLLPIELRKVIINYFELKTSLEGGDPYYYNKSKNKINAIFGMMLTDICRLTITYDGEWGKEDEGVEKLIEKYYNSKNSFLAYQWGIWVTAHARKRLHEPMKDDGCKGYGLYSDTDSWKMKKGYNREVFERINKEIKDNADLYDVKPYVTRKDGSKVYLGIWEYEGRYDSFKTLGAKKYCYEKEGKLTVTVAGLNKKHGAEYLTKIGGIEKFKEGLIFPPEYSKRTYSVYHDVKEPYYEEYNNHRYLTGSSLAIHDTTYELGVTEEYGSLLKEIKMFGLSNIN